MLKTRDTINYQVKYNFLKFKTIFFVCSIILITYFIFSIVIFGLNFGVDFSGGLLIEARTERAVVFSEVRTRLNALKIGNVALQNVVGTDHTMIIRLQQRENAETQHTALAKIREALGTGVEFRRTELVGPKVGHELIMSGLWATALSILAIAGYIWFRFEWQFGLGSMLALLHDVVATVGLFSVTQMEFNLTSIAAILTIAGYSINDSVVVYDRVRENLYKYKKAPLDVLLNLSLNETLSRTLLTSATTALVVVAILAFGGDVLRGFAVAMLWGIVVGTYSSIYIGIPVLLFLNVQQFSEIWRPRPSTNRKE